MKIQLFTTLAFVIIAVSAFAISSPTNTAPTNGATNQQVAVTIDWSTVTGNVGFIYQLDTTPLFNSSLLREDATTINSSQAAMYDLYFGTTYYWRAATKSAVDTSAWSATWSFTTLATFANVSPSNGAVNQPVAVTIDWSSVTGNSGFIYQLDTTPLFNSGLLTQQTMPINTSQATLYDLYFGTKYYWRAAAKTLVDTSEWSATWNFTTTDMIYNTSPTNAATSRPVGLTLDWSSVDGNTGYIYQYDTVSSFDSPMFVVGTTAANSSQVYVTNLRFGQSYYWRVSAKNAVDTSAWSTTWSFTTAGFVYNVSPSNNATSQPVGLTLDWSGIDGNTGYIYQYDTVSGFDSPMFYSGITAADFSQVYISNLRFGQKYYWRVAAKNAVDTSAWSSAWSFTIADFVYNMSPSNNATSQPVGLTLDWSSINGNTGYIYQYDTVSGFDSPMFYSGITAADFSQVYISNLRFGQKYYWRVAAKNAVDTSAWSSAWSFTTADFVYNMSPSNNATSQPVGLTLDWSSIDGNTGYIYQYDTVSGFDSPMFYSGITAADFSQVYISNFRFGQQYYWRVAAKNAVDTSAWTSAWTFTTGDDVTNYTPANGAAGISVNPTLDWSSFTGSTGYMCRIDTTMNFNSPELQTFSGANSTSGFSGLLYGTEYYWQAAARNDVDTSQWNTAWMFTTAFEMTTPPTLISPANSSTDISYLSVGLEWGSIVSANTYQFQVSTNSGFTSLIYNNTTSLVTASISGLNPYTVYYWRVRASNANGNSPWSTVWSFTTESADLTAPILVSPTNGATEVATASLFLDWNSVFGASAYVFEITEDENFVSGITTQQVSETYKEIIGLSDGTEYFWRVKATDGAVYSDWSEVWSFTTEIDGLDAPVLVLPLNNSTGVDFNSVVLNWNPVAGATQYIYEYSTDNTFLTNVVTETVAISENLLSSLGTNLQYFWRVKATNGIIESTWSQVWSFTTESLPLAAPILLSPASNTIEVNLNSVLLEWYIVNGATEYICEYSNDNTFVNDVVSETLSVNEKILTGLEENTQYFWRVKASNGIVESDWSTVWNFTTEVQYLEAPVLTAPLNNSTNIDFNSVTFEWNSVNGATEYIFEYSTDNAFDNLLSEIVYVSEATINGFLQNTQYFWRVKASNGGVYSAWSEVWNFTTDEQIVNYTLTITVEGYGFVFVNSVQYTEPVSVPVGTELTLEAVSITIWPFQQWIGDISGNNNPEILVMDSDKHVTAEFINVSVNDIDTDKNVISIYPNPSSSSFFMMGEGIESVSLFSVDGRLVKSFTEYSEADGLDITDLNSGVYFVKVNNSDTWVGKIIKE